MKQGIKRLICCGGVLIALGVTAAGCGSSEATPMEEAEAEYRALNAESREVSREVQAKLKQFLAIDERTLALRDEQEAAAIQGDQSTVNELQATIDQSRARADAIYGELEPLEAQSGQLERRLAAAGTRLEQLKGCDRECREARDQAIDRQLECVMEQQGLGFEACEKRFPVPRSDILEDVLADDE